MARQQLRHLFLEKKQKDGDGEDPPRRRKGMQLDHTTAQGKKRSNLRCWFLGGGFTKNCNFCLNLLFNDGKICAIIITEVQQ